MTTIAIQDNKQKCLHKRAGISQRLVNFTSSHAKLLNEDQKLQKALEVSPEHTAQTVLED